MRMMFLALFAACFVSIDSAHAENTAELSASVVVQVHDREAAGDAMVAFAAAQGGWFSSLSETGVTLVVPAESVESVLTEARTLGRVVARDYGSVDHGPELTDLGARLKAREEVLDKYLAVLEEAGPDSVVAVERQITRVVAEIEQTEGRLRYLHDRVNHGRIQVGFQFQDRAAPVRLGASSFDWLNSLNLADLTSDFEYGDDDVRACGVQGPVPENFAPFTRRCRIRGVSPDNVMYRVRTHDNDPEADLAFWGEAMRNRMVEAGYHLIAEEAVKAGDLEGAMLELGAADGDRDWTYLVTLFVDGGDLVVVEAAGEVDAFSGHRDAVLAAVSQVEM